MSFTNMRTYIVAVCFTFIAVGVLFAEDKVSTKNTDSTVNKGKDKGGDKDKVKGKDKDKGKNKDKNNPGTKLVVEMLNYFTKVDANRQKYIKGKQDYAQYMKKDQKLSDVISNYIDFYDVCEKSLRYNYDPKKKIFQKDHWVKRSTSDKNEFTSTFMQLIESIVYPIAGEYFKDLNMRHTVLSSKKDDIHLRTHIKNKKKKKRRDQEYIMEWFLHPKKDESGWIIYDISIEDERWVPGFRSQFNDVISKKSYNELVKMMKDKLKETLDDRKTKDQKEKTEAEEKTAVKE